MTSLENDEINFTKSEFKVGDIVWVKIVGYPWWPCKIDEIFPEDKEKPYTVLFLNDNHHSYVKESQIRQFRLKPPVESKQKAGPVYKRCQAAYKQALKILKLKENYNDVTMEETINQTEKQNLNKEEGAYKKLGPKFLVKKEKSGFLKNKRNRTRELSRIKENRHEENSEEEILNFTLNPDKEGNEFFISEKIEKGESSSSTVEDHKTSLYQVILKAKPLDENLKILSETHSDINSLLDSVTNLVNNYEEENLDGPENKKILLKLFGQFLEIFCIYEETHQKISDLVYSLKTSIPGVSSKTFDDLSDFPINKINAMIRLLKDEIPDSIIGEALPYATLHKFFINILLKSFGEIVSENIQIKTLEDFYLNVIEGNYLKESNELLISKVKSDNGKRRSEIRDGLEKAFSISVNIKYKLIY
jgi:hypothetical protein